MISFSHFRNGDYHLPPGFRFHPTDEEIITYYLFKKVTDNTFTCRVITEVDLNKCEPWELPEKSGMGAKERYFFSLRDRKYPTGLRTNRATDAGYWKATGKDRAIYSSKTGSLVGMKKTLVFYRGRAPKGEKSNWVMHEYRLEGKLNFKCISRTSKDEWVISRVFQKHGTGTGTVRATVKKNIRSDVCGSIYGVDLPSLSLLPLDESSPYSVTTGGSYENDNTAKHVPCFSTITDDLSQRFLSDPLLGQPVCHLDRGLNSGVQDLQGLRFLSGVADAVLPSLPVSLDHNGSFYCDSSENWRNFYQKPSSHELDCLWI